MLLSRGDLAIFLERPISAGFIAASVLLIAAQIVAYLRGLRAQPRLRPALTEQELISE